MISKAKAVKGSAASIDYIMKEEKNCYELCRNDVIGQDGKEILSEFREIQSMNDNCQNNTFSIVLSPNNDQTHSAEDLLKYTNKHLENLGLKDNQYIAYVHQNTKATHVHIIANRIDYQGNALSDSYIGLKAQNSAEEIAKENGLKTAKEVRQEKEIEKLSTKDINKEIKAEIQKAHNQSVNKSWDFSDYIQNMNDKGYTIEPSINKQNQFQGFKIHDRTSDLTFKASEIGKNCGAKSMIENGVNFDNLTTTKLGLDTKNIPIQLSTPLNNIAEQVFQALKSIAKSADRGIGY